MSRRNAVCTLVVLSALLVLAGCASKKPPATKRYHLDGRVVAIDKPEHQVTIDGKEIPGFMGAMTMAYRVPDDAALNKLSVGDAITAEVVVSDSKYWLEEVRVGAKTAK